jgi:hypothetical protein
MIPWSRWWFILGTCAALVASPLSAQSIRGRVVDESSGEAVSGVSAVLVNPSGVQQGATQSDPRGRFVLRAPAPGRYRIRVFHIGYGDFYSDLFEVEANETVEVDVRLSMRPIAVDSLVVTTERRLRQLERTGFYERQRSGFGRFITREQIEARAGGTVFDLLRNYPSVRVINVGGGGMDRDLVMRAGASMSMRGVCLPSIVIDGLIVRPGGSGAEPGLRSLLPMLAEVEAIEVYTGGAGLPAWAAGTYSPCGSLLIWTRG